jgi:16S rRNA (uracil1498-N3)-methyltransferase
MPAPWFYCERLVAGVVELDERERRHALTVLRLEPPAEIRLFDGRGTVAAAELRRVETGGVKRRTDATIQFFATSVEQRPRPVPVLTLIVAACKGPRLDTLVEKCTELGVDRLTLAHFERSVVRLEPRHAGKLRATGIAACKQSRNPWLPVIETGAAFRAALDGQHHAALVAAHLDQTGATIADVACELIRTRIDTAIVIGPEGGLAPGELDLLGTRGARFVRLSPFVLRVETAAIVAAAHWSALRTSRT